MKKLFSLFGLLGLLAFVATPIYAQEEQEATLDEQIVAEADDIVAEAEEAVEDVAVEIADAEEAVEDTAEDVAEEATEEVEDFAALLNTDEVQNAFSGFTNEEAAWIIWIFAWLWMWLLFVLGFVGFILWILRIIALWKAFERAGESGWKALIPVYCSYIKYKLAWMKNWFWYCLLIALIMWVIAACMPDQQELITNVGCLITSIIYIVMLFKFARKYGWGVFASVLFVIFYPICVLILGFGNYPYQGKTEEIIVEA